MRTTTICLMALFLTTAAAAATLDYTAYWSHLGDVASEHFTYDCGGYRDVVVKGEIAYVLSDGHGIQVVDCRNPAHLVNRGFLGVTGPRHCAVRDHYLYVSTTQGRIEVVDVDDHDAPVWIDTILVPGGPDDLLVIGPWLYVQRAGNQLDVYSLADSSDPQLVNTLTLPAGRDQFLAGDGDLIIAAGHDGLTAISIAVPDWPAVRGSLELATSAQDVAVRGDLVLVGTEYDSYLVDASDPTALSVVSTLPVQGLGVLLTSTGEAWLGWGNCWFHGGMHIYDVSDPAAPVWIHDEISGLRGWPEAMVESQGRVYLAEFMCWCAGEWPGFHVYRLGELPPPGPLAAWDADYPLGLVADGSRVRVARIGGLDTWDVADPADPQLLQSLAFAGTCWRLAAENDLVVTFVANNGSPNWLQVLTRTADGLLAPDGQLDFGTYPKDISLSGDLAMVSFVGHIDFVDVSDRANPVTAGTMIPDGDLICGAIHQDIAAVSTNDALSIFDISDLAAPQLLAEYDSLYKRRWEIQFATRGERLLLLTSRDYQSSADWGNHAEIYDLTDPTAPILLADIPELPGEPIRGLDLAGDLFATTGTLNLHLHRWDDDTDQPVLLGRVALGADLYSYEQTRVAVTSTCLVVSHTSEGLQTWPLPAGVITPVLDPVPAPAALALAAAPNPFNPACELRFALPTDAAVQLDIFDLRGRRVRRLLDERRAAGTQTARWNGATDDGRPLAAGVYLARLRAGGRSATVKLTLVE